MSVVMEIMSDSPDEMSETTEPTLDYPDENRLLTPTSDFDFSRSGDEDYESRAEKMQELEDYVNVTAAVMAKRSRRKTKQNPDKPSRRGSETSESERYLKKIKTLQQNKRRQETRNKKLAREVKVLKDKLSIQASYIDVLCGMLSPELSERFRGRQGLGILGNVLPETSDLRETSAQADPSDIAEEPEPSMLGEKENDCLVEVNEEDGKFHCVEDLTEEQSDGRSITAEGEQERISRDFGDGAVEKTQHLEKDVPAADVGSEIADLTPDDDKKTEDPPADPLAGITESSDNIISTEDSQVADMAEPIKEDPGSSEHVELNVENADPPGTNCALSEENSTMQQQVDSSCASTEQTTVTASCENGDVQMVEDGSTEGKHSEQTEPVPAQQNSTTDPSLQPDVKDETVTEDTKSDQGFPISKEAPLETAILPSPEPPRTNGTPCDIEASKHPLEETEKKHDSMDSVILDYPAIASATIDDFLAEYAPREENSPTKYTTMDVSMPGPSNVTVPVVSIPPVSLSVPIVSIPSSSISVPIVTVPPASRSTKSLPRLSMRGRRNPRRRCTFRTRPNIPALRNEHLIQQDYSIAGISPLQFCSKYDFSPQSDVSQQYRHPVSSSVGNFIQTGNLPVQSLALGSSAFDGIMAGYQNPQSLCISGLDGSISQGNISGTASDRNLSDLVLSDFGAAAKFNNV